MLTTRSFFLSKYFLGLQFSYSKQAQVSKLSYCRKYNSGAISLPAFIPIVTP